MHWSYGTFRSIRIKYGVVQIHTRSSKLYVSPYRPGQYYKNIFHTCVIMEIFIYSVIYHLHQNRFIPFTILRINGFYSWLFRTGLAVFQTNYNLFKMWLKLNEGMDNWSLSLLCMGLNSSTMCKLQRRFTKNTVEVRSWVGNHTLLFCMDVITYSWLHPYVGLLGTVVFHEHIYKLCLLNVEEICKI